MQKCADSACKIALQHENGLYSAALPVQPHCLFSCTARSAALPVQPHCLFSRTACSAALPVQPHCLFSRTARSAALPVQLHCPFSCTVYSKSCYPKFHRSKNARRSFVCTFRMNDSIHGVAVGPRFSAGVPAACGAAAHCAWRAVHGVDGHRHTQGAA